jgi:hypothetical protein
MRSLRWTQMWAYGLASDVRAELSPAEFIGGYGTPRGADGIGCGVGCGVWSSGGSREAAFSPGTLTPKWWCNTTGTVDRTYSAQPVIPNPGFDTDTEWNKGTNWAISGGFATCSPAPGSPSNLYDAVGIITGTRQVCTLDVEAISGTLEVRGSSGIHSPAVSTTGLVETEGALNGTLYLQCTAGSTVSLDSVGMACTSLASLDPSAGSTLTGSFAQATAVNQPYDYSTDNKWIVLDGSSDHYVSGDAAAAWNWVSSGMTYMCAWVLGSTTGWFFDCLNSTAGYGAGAYWDGTAKQLHFMLGVGGATKNVTVSDVGEIEEGVPLILAIRLNTDGTVDVFRDGVKITTAVNTTYTPAAGTPTTTMYIGKRAGSASCITGRFSAPMFAGVLTDEQITEAFEWYSDELSIPLATDELSDAELLTWSGLVEWIDNSTVTYGTQPTTPADLDMEAVGTAAWSPNDCALSKISAAPDGVGAQALHLAGGGATYFATQAAGLETGAYHHAQMTVRGDRDPVFLLGHSSRVAASGTASGASWQNLSGCAAAYNGNILVGTLGAGGGYVDLDNLEIANVSVTQLTPSVRIGSTTYDQATAGYRPYVDPDEPDALQFTNAHKLTHSGAAADHKFLHDGTGMTVFAMIKPGAVDGHLCGTSNSAGSSGIRLELDSLYFKVQVYAGTGLPVVDMWTPAAVFTVGYWKSVALSWPSAAAPAVGFVSGAPEMSDTASSVSSSDPPGSFVLGGTPTTSTYVGAIGVLLTFSRGLSSTEVYRLHTKFSALFP